MVAKQTQQWMLKEHSSSFPCCVTQSRHSVFHSGCGVWGKFTSQLNRLSRSPPPPFPNLPAPPPINVQCIRKFIIPSFFLTLRGRASHSDPHPPSLEHKIYMMNTYNSPIAKRNFEMKSRQVICMYLMWHVT